MRVEGWPILALLVLGAGPVLGEGVLPALVAALPEGAVETTRSGDPVGPHGIAIGPAGPMAPPPEQVQPGRRLRIAWTWPAGAADAVEDRLDAALQAAGFAPLYRCRTDGCGGFDFRRALPVLPLPDMAVDLGDFRYLAAARDDPPALAALLVSGGQAATHAQITLVLPPDPTTGREGDEPRSASPPLPPPAVAPFAPAGADPAPDLGTELEVAGRAVLDGVAFAPGSTVLEPRGRPALAALADWLGADPARRVALVGHTDWTGPTNTNLALSRARAAAVAAVLEDLGADPAQISVAGVGPFAPRAVNTDAEGRGANRRVEAVRLPPGR